MTDEEIDKQVEELARAMDGGIVMAKIVAFAKHTNPSHILGLSPQQCADLVYLIDNARKAWKNGR